MIKFLLAILLSCFLTTSIVSCSFLGSSSDESAEEVTDADEDFGEDEDYDPLTDEDSDVAEIDDAEDENLFDDGDDTGDFDDDLEEGFGDEDTSLADASDAIEDITDDELLEEGDALAGAEATEGPQDDFDFEDEPKDEVAAETITEEEVVADNNEIVPEVPAEEIIPSEEASEPSEEVASTDVYYDDAPKKSWVPVQKVKSTPFNKNGILANAIYIVRDGDSIGSISQKIYGEDKKADLLKVNTTLARRGVKVGDKVYYNSPQRPTDSGSLLTYYEDLSLSPQTYSIQAGENIREVAKNLLGHSQSWKEIWATNPSVSSKGNVDDSYELRYWSEGGPTVATTIAQNDIAPPAEEEFNAPPPEEAMPEPPVAAVEEAPPVDAFADQDLPPPPPPIEEVAPMPPPVTANVAPPAPPSRVKAPPMPPTGSFNKNFKRKTKKIASTADKEQKMMLGALAIGLLAAILLFIIYRKKRSRRAIDFNTSTTQIE